MSYYINNPCIKIDFRYLLKKKKKGIILFVLFEGYIITPSPLKGHTVIKD